MKIKKYLELSYNKNYVSENRSYIAKYMAREKFIELSMYIVNYN